MNETGVDDYMDAQDKRIAKLEAENERLQDMHGSVLMHSIRMRNERRR